MAGLIAVKSPEPSCATVMAVFTIDAELEVVLLTAAEVELELVVAREVVLLAAAELELVDRTDVVPESVAEVLL